MSPHAVFDGLSMLARSYLGKNRETSVKMFPRHRPSALNKLTLTNQFPRLSRRKYMAGQNSLEISFSQDAGFADAAGAVGAKAKEAFDALGVLLSDAIAPLRQKLAETSASADEVELKLDLALKAEGKWVIVSMEGVATVSVKLVWKRKPSDGGSDV
jgi:hypothetical protein